MASVTILEQDYTESSAYEPTETVVYIPGLAGEDCTDADALVGKPVLYSSVSAFTTAVGTTPKDISTTTTEDEGSVTIPAYDKSYVMAKQLIALGMPVLYEVVADPSDTTKAATKAEQVIERLKNSQHWAKLYDRSLYNPRFITSGGYAAIQKATGEGGITTYIGSIATNMLNVAHFSKGDTAESNVGRGDCVALIDHEKDVLTVSDVNDMFNGENSPLANAGALGTFGAAFTPWCSHSLTIQTGVASPDDAVNGTWALPGSFTYLVAYETALANNPTWYAAAGVTRGACATLVKPLAEFGELASSVLQSREDGKIAVNPIVNINPYGYRIYGNRTLRQNGLDATSNLVATSFLNIRNLVSDIKKTTFAACRRMAFEQNTDILWFNLKSHISPLLEKMKAGNGIEDYKLTRVKTTEKGKLIAKVRVVPIEAAEDFEVTIELADSVETESEA